MISFQECIKRTFCACTRTYCLRIPAVSGGENYRVNSCTSLSRVRTSAGHTLTPYTFSLSVLGLPEYCTTAFREGIFFQTSSTFFSWASFSTTRMLHSELLATYSTASAELVEYIPTDSPLQAKGT